MPEYLAPGVYIEEVSFRSKSIEGVSTTTTGFVGPTRYGPTDLEPELLTSLADFARIYGGGEQLKYGAAKLHNYMWHAVRAFFSEGGSRLYVTRTFLAGGDDGRARHTVSGSPATTQLKVSARYPGDAGNVRVRLTLGVGPNILTFDRRPESPGSSTMMDVPRAAALADRDVVLITQGAASQFYLATFVTSSQTWQFERPGSTTLTLADFQRSSPPSADPKIQAVTVTVTVIPTDPTALPEVWTGLALDAAHATSGARDSLLYSFADDDADARERNRRMPIVIAADPATATGLDLLDTLLAASPAVTATATQPGRRSLRDELLDPKSSDPRRTIEFELSGGNDGQRPTATEYEGKADPDSKLKTGLKQFEDIDDISIVAAPGSTFGYDAGYTNDANTIVSLLIGHCEHMRYRIAVIDAGNGQSLNQVQAMRARFDSSWGAFYYPWVRVLDPVTRVPIHLPPSGFVAGIYGRNDVTRAVYKAPANEVVNLALGFELTLNKAQQDVLNPQGINCFRFFEGRGNRLWGGRTMSSDPEWKYVNLRRYFAYLEHSIDKGTQWAVFEPNGPSLWGNVRQTIEDFLLNEYVNGALLGDTPAKAFFVRCDRSTMTQNDLDNGRLICLIGVSPVRPAEFVIFRIGQWTADRK